MQALQVLGLQSTLAQRESTITVQDQTIQDLSVANSELEQQLQAQTIARRAAEELHERIHAQRQAVARERDSWRYSVQQCSCKDAMYSHASV